MAGGAGPNALAADFTQAKQVYVPPSRIPRRLDFAAIRERAAAVIAGPQGYSAPSGIRSGSGLIPPPPPSAPVGGSLVPPPPVSAPFYPGAGGGGVMPASPLGPNASKLEKAVN